MTKSRPARRSPFLSQKIHLVLFIVLQRADFPSVLKRGFLPVPRKDHRIRPVKGNFHVLRLRIGRQKQIARLFRFIRKTEYFLFRHGVRHDKTEMFHICAVPLYSVVFVPLHVHHCRGQNSRDENKYPPPLHSVRHTGSITPHDCSRPGGYASFFSRSRTRFSKIASSCVKVLIFRFCLDAIEVKDRRIMIRKPMAKRNRPFILS